VLGLALIAAACGGDDDTGAGSETATEGTIDQGVANEVKGQLGAESTTTAEGTATTTATTAAKITNPTSIEQWEELWAQERAAVVKKIKDGKFGLSADGKTLNGPEGFTIDLGACPAGWSNTEGLTDTEIKIGHTTALSGTLADYGNIAKGVDVTIQYYNKKGAFKDSTGKTRNVNYIVKDDGYDATRTIPLVDELLTSDKVFWMQTLGSPNTMKTYDKINQSCVAQALVMTGHPAWGDPVNHPWTGGYQLAYNTEAVLWGAFVEQNIDKLTAKDGKATVAALVMNNDFGKAYDAGFKNFLAQSSMKDKIEYVSETIEPSAPTVTDPMTTLASKNPEMFIAMTAGASCTQSINAAAENGMKASAQFLFMPAVCKSASFVGKDKVGGDGSQSDGWWIVGGGNRDFNSPGEDNNVFVKWGRDLLTEAGVDYKTSGSFGTGVNYGWTMAQILMIAGELDGGLNRTNLMLAYRSIEMTNPMLLDGIKFNMNGAKDAYLVEGSDIAVYNAATQSWTQQGAVIELSGKSSNCAWDQSIGNCK
jgi:branched-chain amino acid transport system substrate-binding protein